MGWGWGGAVATANVAADTGPAPGSAPHPDLSTRQRLQGHFSQACFYKKQVFHSPRVMLPLVLRA